MADNEKTLLSDVINEGDRIKLCWETDKAETDLSGLKMTVSAYLTIRGEVMRKTEYAALSGGEGI